MCGAAPGSLQVGPDEQEDAAEPDEQSGDRAAVNGSPPFSTDSTPTIQNGEVASTTAVSPLGTNSSAQTTMPLPSPIMSTLSNARPGQVRGPG